MNGLRRDPLESTDDYLTAGLKRGPYIETDYLDSWHATRFVLVVSDRWLVVTRWPRLRLLGWFARIAWKAGRRRRIYRRLLRRADASTRS